MSDSGKDPDDWNVDTQDFTQDGRGARTQLGTGAEAIPVNNWTRSCMSYVHTRRLGKD